MATLFAIRRRRRMQTERVRKNPLAQLTELEIIQNYRLSKAAILELCSLLKHDLQRKNHGWRTLTVEEQVLISLKVLASGSFQNSLKDDINVLQPTVSKVLSNFMDGFISKKKSFIYMPNDSDAVISKQQFYSLACFPGIIGTIDGHGSHVPIIAPKEDEHLFVNRKNFHSINVQVCAFYNVICLKTLKVSSCGTLSEILYQLQSNYEFLSNCN